MKQMPFRTVGSNIGLVMVDGVVVAEVRGDYFDAEDATAASIASPTFRASNPAVSVIYLFPPKSIHFFIGLIIWSGIGTYLSLP